MDNLIKCQWKSQQAKNAEYMHKNPETELMSSFVSSLSREGRLRMSLDQAFPCGVWGWCLWSHTQSQWGRTTTVTGDLSLSGDSQKGKNPQFPCHCFRWPCLGRGLDWAISSGPFQPQPSQDSGILCGLSLLVLPRVECPCQGSPVAEPKCFLAGRKTPTTAFCCCELLKWWADISTEMEIHLEIFHWASSGFSSGSFMPKEAQGHWYSEVKFSFRDELQILRF